MPDSTLYERLGGVHAIATVVDDFIDRSMRNPVTMANKKVADAYGSYSTPALKYLVTEMICAVTGGPQTYTGRNMADSHDHLAITDEEFNIFAGDLIQSLNLFGVPQDLQDELIAIAATTHDDIVTK